MQPLSVEQVNGQPFTEYATKNIFELAGMSSNIFQISMPYEDRTDMAVPFNDNFEEDETLFKIKLPLMLFSTTTRDLYKFNQAMHNFTLTSERSLFQIAQPTDLGVENR
jgi:CubicO group peptidase (beta-lactamase class C family)